MVIALSGVGLLKAVDGELFAAVDATLEHAGGAACCDVDVIVSHILSVNEKNVLSHVLVSGKEEDKSYTFYCDDEPKRWMFVTYLGSLRTPGRSPYCSSHISYILFDVGMSEGTCFVSSIVWMCSLSSKSR